MHMYMLLQIPSADKLPWSFYPGVDAIRNQRIHSYSWFQLCAQFSQLFTLVSSIISLGECKSLKLHIMAYNSNVESSSLTLHPSHDTAQLPRNSLCDPVSPSTYLTIWRAFQSFVICNALIIRVLFEPVYIYLTNLSIHNWNFIRIMSYFATLNKLNLH